MTDVARFKKMDTNCSEIQNTVKLGDKERLDKKQIGAKEPFPVTNFASLLHKDKENLALNKKQF